MISDSTNATDDDMPMLELTVGVRDGGSPSRSALGRLTVVVDALGAGPEGEPVITRSSSVFRDLLWSHKLFIIVGSALGAAVLAIVIFTVVVSTVTHLLLVVYNIVVPYTNYTNFTVGKKFWNFTELYEFYAFRVATVQCWSLWSWT